MTLVAAGECVHQSPGIRRFLFDYSPDMEYLEIVSPALFGTVDTDAPCDVPTPAAWPPEAIAAAAAQSGGNPCGRCQRAVF